MSLADATSRRDVFKAKEQDSTHVRHNQVMEDAPAISRVHARACTLLEVQNDSTKYVTIERGRDFVHKWRELKALF